MNVLGINGFGKNSSVCIVRDGKILAFVEHERFSRTKGDDRQFPSCAVLWCLSHAKLDLESIDVIAFGWDCTKYPWRMLKTLSGNYIKYISAEKRAFHKQKQGSTVSHAIDTLAEYAPSKIKLKIFEGLRSAGLKGKMPEIEFVSHHLAHAFSCYFCSAFTDAGILTLDGSGEDICTQLAVGKGNDVRVLETIPIPHSLGWFYAAITDYLGFRPYLDEGKVMGLAAYGQTRRENNKWIEPLSRILKIRKDYYEVDPIFTKFGGHYYGTRFTDEMVKYVTSIDTEAVPVAHGEKIEINGKAQSKYLLDVYVDIAYAAQHLLEEASVMLAKKLVRNYGVKNLCIAGGVGLNCKMNGEILKRSGCENIFVQPASGDAGVALGAALYVSKKRDLDVRNPLRHVYYGPEYSNGDIQGILDNCKLAYKKVDDPSKEAVDLLEKGKIIAWFQGRMEFGPRALGNRSILANPLFSGIKNKVNCEVKYREAWRPFCPSLITEEKNKYIKDAKDAPFMIVAFGVNNLVRDKISSVVHVDDTLRPQTVKEEDNPLYYRLISNFGKRTGDPIVLNTSLNVRGEPIICNPLDAIRCFHSNGLDALIIGNFILPKKEC